MLKRSPSQWRRVFYLLWLFRLTESGKCYLFVKCMYLQSICAVREFTPVLTGVTLFKTKQRNAITVTDRAVSYAHLQARGRASCSRTDVTKLTNSHNCRMRSVLSILRTQKNKER